MNRKYDTNLYLEKVRLLREQFPTMKLTTDIIVGFPGETDEEFNETMEFVKTAHIDKVHVFPYSVRKGTKAAGMPQVDGTVKKNRCELLRKLSDEQEELFAKMQIGKELEVLIEADHDDMYVGYTREYVKALVSHDKKLEIGGIAKVKATGNMYSSLICKVF
jgi:threonylcarbamoyladenosine tRNA methylthiotransferase MtaB